MLGIKGKVIAITGASSGIGEATTLLSMTNPEVKSRINDQMNKLAIPPAAIAGAIAFAIEQPAEIDVNEIVIRPTAQV